MRLNLTHEQIENATWVEWESNKHGVVTAHAVDPTSEARTGKLRSVNGAVIPEHAKPAKPGTPRDPFSVSILDRAREKLVSDAARAAERAAKRKPSPDGITRRGDVAEVWLEGQKIGEFSAGVLAEVLRQVVVDTSPVPVKAPKHKKPKKTENGAAQAEG